MPADHELDPLDGWLNQQVQPLPPPPGTFELITKRARRRKTRKAVVSIASAAAVAAAIGVIVPLSTTLHLTTTTSGNNVSAAGSVTPTTPESESPLGHGTQTPTSASSNAATSVRPQGSSAAYLPPDYVPSTVTWDSTSTGWVMGPAGTPGKCANADPTICTSIARTDDGGKTWQGVPAPDTGTGVSGLRFLNASYGWAFGPDLWATDDGGAHWHAVPTGKSSVTELETANGRAYALFGDCAPTRTDGATNDNCTSYTLETAVAGSDTWTPVGGVPANLAPSSGGGTQAGAAIELDGTAGYLVAPDGTLYSGPLDGTAWHKVADLPCSPGSAKADGQPQGLLLTPAGVTSGSTRLALVCWQAASSTTSVYMSTDDGSNWSQETGVGSVPATSVPTSLTALPDGTLILAAVPGSAGGSSGIFLLAPGATQWQAAALSDSSGKTYGFTYVGMTSPTQGVALGGNPDLHAIWMTVDGGQTWQVRPIQS